MLAAWLIESAATSLPMQSESVLGRSASGILMVPVPSTGSIDHLRLATPEPILILDEPTKALGRQILNLVRQENIGGLIARARRLETEAPELGIRLEDENGSLYLRYGKDRVLIRRPAPPEGVRYVGEFGAEIGARTGHPLPVRIDVETISRLAAYIERQ